MTKEALLKQVPLFQDLGSAELDLLAGRAVRKQLSKGEMLFCEGDKAHGLYLVEQGSVKIFKLSGSGREQVLHVERAGDSIAELPLFDGGPYPASAAALEDSTLLFIDKRAFDELCLAHPSIGLSVIRVIGKRLRKLTRLLEEIALKDVGHRLAWWLLERAEEHGVRRGDTVELEIKLSHSDIGTRIGTVREVVTRTFSRLEAEGLIEVNGKVVRIPKIERLRDACSG
ncbi:MAG: Crp/Fnr family transcriptional regulator [Acidobacteriota bacterium]